jgi:hypothetical protein
MEKYGVDEAKPEFEKLGTDKCPLCGAPLEVLDEVGVYKCPVHGTSPFEQGKSGR